MGDTGFLSALIGGDVGGMGLRDIGNEAASAPSRPWAYGALTAGSAIAGAASQFTAAGAIDASSDFNRKLAGVQASDAVTRGDMAANAEQAKARQTAGYAHAAAGASGVDSSTGSVAENIAGIGRSGAIDAATIRANAAREAWGLTTQATIDAAGMSSRAGAMRTGAYTTLLNGAGKTYGIFTNDGNKADSSPTGRQRPPRVKP